MMKPPLTALLCGGAQCVFDDIVAAKEIFVPDVIFAVNDIVARLPLVDFFVTVHPTRVPNWIALRRANGYSQDPKAYWTIRDRPLPFGFEFKVTQNTHGGSGLLAVSVARYLGFQKIVLAGMPMTKEGAHFFNSKPWKECNIYYTAWKRVGFGNDIRSMSGWTRDHLGLPTLEWLRSQEPIR